METGPVEAVTQRPRHPYTVALTAAAPVPSPAEQAARRAAREALGVVTASYEYHGGFRLRTLTG
jgi:peptide/nickel transport system ATP-binding protein